MVERHISEPKFDWQNHFRLWHTFFISISCGTPTTILTQSPISTLDANGTLNSSVENTIISTATETLSSQRTLDAKRTLSPTVEIHPKSTATEIPSPQSTLIPSATFTPESLCTKMRFAEYLGPDDVDEMINEGVSFIDVSEIAVRFDCSTITSNQMTWEWRRNSYLHCTNTFQSKDCDQSTLISWDSLPGKFLITLFSKDGYLGNLEPGDYELIIYISDSEILCGSIGISK